jgi:hypothetical protein
MRAAAHQRGQGHAGEAGAAASEITGHAGEAGSCGQRDHGHAGEAGGCGQRGQEVTTGKVGGRPREVRG